jgi:hypothetical protein
MRTNTALSRSAVNIQHRGFKQSQSVLFAPDSWPRTLSVSIWAITSFSWTASPACLSTEGVSQGQAAVSGLSRRHRGLGAAGKATTDCRMPLKIHPRGALRPRWLGSVHAGILQQREPRAAHLR